MEHAKLLEMGDGGSEVKTIFFSSRGYLVATRASKAAHYLLLIIIMLRISRIH